MIKYLKLISSVRFISKLAFPNFENILLRICKHVKDFENKNQYRFFEKEKRCARGVVQGLTADGKRPTADGFNRCALCARIF